jgi:hypothetical protein
MTRTELIALLEHPRETLAVEIKQWIRPDDPIGGAKLAKALMALRNFDGGVLVLGLDDKTYGPATDDQPVDVQEAYHPDAIQAIVGKYARPPFEVNVHFIPNGEVEIPVIVVPGGITSPVMSRSTIRELDGRVILEQNAIYTRCLANDLVSSSKPVTPADWESLLSRCFDNREANVAKFIERHIPKIVEYLYRPQSVVETSQLTEAMDKPTAIVPAKEADERADQHLQIPIELLDYGRTRFEARVVELHSSGKLAELPAHGSWETACEIYGCSLDYAASDKFLSELFLHQPGYTGWPMWRDTRSTQNASFRPYPFNRGWESLVVRLNQPLFANHIDFWRIEPRGRFYEYRALEDDIAGTRGNQRIPAMKALDFLLVIGRVTEAIAVCLSYAKGLGCPEAGLLNIAFRWTKIRGRELASWAEPLRTLFPSSEAVQDEITTRVIVPLSTGIAEVPQYTRQATVELFEAFGKEFAQPVYEEIAGKIIRRGNAT